MRGKGELDRVGENQLVPPDITCRKEIFRRSGKGPSGTSGKDSGTGKTQTVPESRKLPWMRGKWKNCRHVSRG